MAIPEGQGAIHEAVSLCDDGRRVRASRYSFDRARGFLPSE